MDAAAFVLFSTLFCATMTTSSSKSSPTTTTTNDDASVVVPRTCFEAVAGHDLTDRIYLVTGAYVGLGAATTRALLQAGGTVIVAGRNRQLQDAFVQQVLEQDGGSALAEQMDASHTLDLADLASVRDFCVYIEETYPKIDGLVLNAGVMATPFGTTKQGLEIQMGVNAVGHFLLARRLAKRVRRQVWVSSRGHSMWSAPPPKFDNAKAPRIDLDAIAAVDEASYDTWRRYQQSKLANVLLAKQFAAMGHEAVSIHPGLVQTNLFRHGNPVVLAIFQGLRWIMGDAAQTPEEGARTQTLLTVQPQVESGGYYGKCMRDQEADAALQADDAKALFEYCDKFTQEYQK